MDSHVHTNKSEGKQKIMARKSTLSRTVKFMLVLFGIWPGMSCVLLCRVFWIVTMAIVLFYQYRHFLTHVRTADLFNLMDCLCCSLAHTKVTIKFLVFWSNQQKFVKLLTMMSEDWSDCAKSDVGIRETACKTRISDRIMNAIIILHTITVVAYCTGIIVADVDVNDRGTVELPYINNLDIDVNTQRVYRCILIAEFLHMIMCGWAAGVTNALLLTLVLHAAGQIEILNYWLTQLVPNGSERKRKSIVAAMKKIVRKHQRIISFSKNVESLYTSIALLQFASNTIMICLLGFLIVTAIGTPNAVETIARSLLFYTITNLEAFIFCYAGEYLNNKSKAIGIATYNTAWYDLKPKDCRALLFVILRSQRQLTLTAGKMVDLSLEAFASIMNASGSYLSMLLAMRRT